MALNYNNEDLPYAKFVYKGHQKTYSPPEYKQSYTLQFKSSVGDVEDRYKKNFTTSSNTVERLVELSQPVYPSGQLLNPETQLKKLDNKYISASF